MLNVHVNIKAYTHYKRLNSLTTYVLRFNYKNEMKCMQVLVYFTTFIMQ